MSAAAPGADLQGRVDAAEGRATAKRNVSGVPPTGSGGAYVLERDTSGGDGALMSSLLELELEDASLAGEEGGELTYLRTDRKSVLKYVIHLRT